MLLGKVKVFFNFSLFCLFWKQNMKTFKNSRQYSNKKLYNNCENHLQSLCLIFRSEIYAVNCEGLSEGFTF